MATGPVNGQRYFFINRIGIQWNEKIAILKSNKSSKYVFRPKHVEAFCGLMGWRSYIESNGPWSSDAKESLTPDCSTILLILHGQRKLIPGFDPIMKISCKNNATFVLRISIGWNHFCSQSNCLKKCSIALLWRYWAFALLLSFLGHFQ